MDETLYSFQQISRACGLSVQRLERSRYTVGLRWHPKGYTLEQVMLMIRGIPLPDRRELAGCRSQKTLVLYNMIQEGRGGQA